MISVKTNRFEFVPRRYDEQRRSRVHFLLCAYHSYPNPNLCHPNPLNNHLAPCYETRICFCCVLRGVITGKRLFATLRQSISTPELYHSRPLNHHLYLSVILISTKRRDNGRTDIWAFCFSSVSYSHLHLSLNKTKQHPKGESKYLARLIAIETDY